MPDGRPTVPAELKRALLVEAGHRCAIPTCRHPRVEIAHIIPWSECKEHDFSNLIALCANCHDLYDNGRLMDRSAMRQYKTNLAIVNSRYIDFERRILEYFSQNPDESMVRLPGGMELSVMYLLRDGLLVAGEVHSINTTSPSSAFTWQTAMGVEYYLTDAGRSVVDRMSTGEGLDPMP